MSAEKPHRFSKPQVTGLLLGADLMTVWRLTQPKTCEREEELLYLENDVNRLEKEKHSCEEI